MAARDTVFPNSAFKAISDGDQRSFELLVTQNKMRLNEVRGDHGDTLLHCAARAKGRGIALAMCEILITCGVRPGLATDYGRTALHEAVRTRAFNKEVASLLRSSVNEQDNDGRTALMFAAEGAGLFGSRRGNVSIARELLALGADPEVQDKYGKTALGYAMASNDTDRNGEMIALLKDAMLTAAALREFKRQFSFNFVDPTGVLEVEPRVEKRQGR